MAITISGCGSNVRSAAFLGLETAPGPCSYRSCFYSTLQTLRQRTLSLPFNTQSAACVQLPAQLLQVRLAVITFLVGCILFLLLVAPDVSSCQLVAPLSQSKEARAEWHFGNSFKLVVFKCFFHSHICTHPVCFCMEKWDSLCQCKVLSRSGKWIHKWRNARNALLEVFLGHGQPILSEADNQQVHSVLKNKCFATHLPWSPLPTSSSGRTSVRKPSAKLKETWSQSGMWELPISCLKVTPRMAVAFPLHYGAP